jgi:dTDP-4-amino-4,6-dideoxygalactose transaminase
MIAPTEIMPPGTGANLSGLIAQVGRGQGYALILGATRHAEPIATGLSEAGWTVVVADNDPRTHGRPIGPARCTSFDEAMAADPAVVVCAAEQGRAALLWQLVRHPAYRNQRVHQVIRPDADARATPSFESMTLDRDDVDVALEWLDAPHRWEDDEEARVFAEEFAAWNGSARAWAFMSGREALSACLTALDLEPGDQVLVPGYTCVAVDNAVRFAGLVPVYGDIELETYGLDAASVASRLGPRARALVLPHHYGLVSRDYLELLDLARRRGVRVVEDCAHATGATLGGRRVGTRGDVAFYSSEQSKVFNTTSGGLAVTDDPRLAARLDACHRSAGQADPETQTRAVCSVILNYYSLKHPCRDWTCDVVQARYGAWRLQTTTREEIRGERPPYYGRRMPAPVAAIGRNQLRKLDACNARRRAGAARWESWARETGRPRPTVIPESTPVFLRYPTRVEPARKRDLGWAASELGVPVGVWFRTHLHPSDRVVPDCPRATEAVETCINLPCLLE